MVPLFQDWTNATLEAAAIDRPPSAYALNYQKLWWDGKNSTYCFAGEKSLEGKVPGWDSIPTPPDAIWKFTADGKGSGKWEEALGPSGPMPFPPNLIRPAGGASAFNNDRAFYIGGWANGATTTNNLNINTTDYRDSTPVPGLLVFDFSTVSLTNTTNDGDYFASTFAEQSHPDFQESVMVSVPSFGPEGLFVLLSGTNPQTTSTTQVSSFSNITIYDPSKEQWLSQLATGEVPTGRQGFCIFGIQSTDNDSFEL